MTIGQKLRNFRKRSELTQLDVELAADISPGGLSRIESDFVNPTKETLITLGSILELSQNELTDLFSIRTLFPTPEEVESAAAEIKARFDRPDVFAYLIDEWINIHALSQGFISMLNLSPEEINSIKGRHKFELLLDESGPLRGFMAKDHIEHNLQIELARMLVEIPHFEDSEIFKRLSKLPDFEDRLAKAKLIPTEEVFSPEHKVVYFQLGDQKIRMNFSREHLKQNPRFEVIEYFNPQVI